MASSNSKLIGDERAMERYLELTKTCMKRVKKMTSMQSRRFTSPKLNVEQCKYLVEKLGPAMESALTFSASLTARHISFLSLESQTNCLESFKLLYALAREVESFITNCCKSTWMQAALTLINVSEHITSVGFNLELWRIAFGRRQSLTLAEVSGVYNTEAALVKEKATIDTTMLSMSLHAILDSTKPRSPNHQLATFILDRLQRKMIPAESSSSSSSLSEAALNLRQKDMEKLGKSTAATVYKWTWLGVELVVKVFYGPETHDFTKEVSVLRELFHPNVISLLCFTKDDRKCSIVMERMDQDLHSLMLARLDSRGPKEPPFCISEGVDIMLQIAVGMDYLHESRIAHRDLKSLNILVRCVSGGEVEYVVVKVADFGVSKTKLKSMTFSNQTPNVGTTLWMAPELMKVLDIGSPEEALEGEAAIEKYPLKCDVYSFAMVCYEILTGNHPFSEVSINLKEVRELVLAGGRPRLPDWCPHTLKGLIKQCWSADPALRPSFAMICNKLRLLKCSLLIPAVVDNSLLASNGSSMTTADDSNFSFRDSPPSPHTPPKRSLLQSLSSMSFRIAVPTFLIEPRRCFKSMHTTSHEDNLRSPRGSEIFGSSDCKPFGYLVNQVWPPLDPQDRSNSDGSKMDVIFFEGNVAKKKDMACKETWVQRGKPTVGWPRDWLPEDLGGDVRVLLLEYSISDDGVEEVVKQLQTMLVFRDRYNRGGTWERPIVLVGHSLGCVMIEHLVLALDQRAQSLQRLEDETKDETEIGRAKVAKAFLTSLAGCFFYAPPWAGLLPNGYILKSVFGGLRYSKELFSDLCNDSSNPDSSKLRLLSQDFIRARSNHMKLMAVIEGDHTLGSPTVVHPNSMRDFAGEVVKLEDSNHTDVCKPTDKHHQAYTELLNFVADILNNSKAIQNPSTDKQPAGMLNHEQ